MCILLKSLCILLVPLLNVYCTEEGEDGQSELELFTTTILPEPVTDERLIIPVTCGSIQEVYGNVSFIFSSLTSSKAAGSRLLYYNMKFAHSNYPKSFRRGRVSRRLRRSASRFHRRFFDNAQTSQNPIMPSRIHSAASHRRLSFPEYASHQFGRYESTKSQHFEEITRFPATEKKPSPNAKPSPRDPEVLNWMKQRPGGSKIQPSSSILHPYPSIRAGEEALMQPGLSSRTYSTRLPNDHPNDLDSRLPPFVQHLIKTGTTTTQRPVKLSESDRAKLSPKEILETLDPASLKQLKELLTAGPYGPQPDETTNKSKLFQTFSKQSRKLSRVRRSSHYDSFQSNDPSGNQGDESSKCVVNFKRKGACKKMMIHLKHFVDETRNCDLEYFDVKDDRNRLRFCGQNWALPRLIIDGSEISLEHVHNSFPAKMRFDAVIECEDQTLP